MLKIILSLLLALILALSSLADIVLNGATYLQTNTNVDASELALLNGIDTYQKGNKTTYVFTLPNSRFQINGTLDLDPEREELIFLSSAVTDCMRVGNGGLLRVGKAVSVGSILRYSMGDVLIFPRDTVSQFLIGSLDVQNGGRFEWRGGTIYAGDAMGCSIGGTAEIFAGRFVTTSLLTNTTSSSAMVMRNDGLPDDVICHGVTLDSLNPTSSAPVVFSRNGLNTFVFSTNAGFVQQRNGTWTDALIIRGAEFANNAFIYDYNFVGNNNNYSNDRVQPAEFFNVDVGTGLRQFSATNNLNGHIAFFQELRINVSGLDGLPIEGAIVRVPTTDHGNRRDDNRPLFQNTRTFSNDEFDLHEQSTDLGGEVFFPELLTGRMWLRNSRFEQFDLYSQSGVAGVDDFTAQFISFNELPSSESLILHSSSEIVVNKVLLPDTLLTEQDEEIVRGYNSISTSSEFYDSAKLYLVDNFKGEQSTLVGKSGDTINAGDLSINLSSSYTEAFSFNEDSSSIFVNTDGFVGGLSTSGDVVDNTSSGVINFDVEGTLIISDASIPWSAGNGVSIGNVINSDTNNNLVLSLGEGASVSSTTVGTGNGEVDIRVVRTLELTGIADNTRIYIYNADLEPTDPNFDIDSQVVLNGTYLFSYNYQSDVNVGVRVISFDEGYLEFFTTLTVDNASLPLSQQLDRNYEND